jgi:hypothetical protein
MINELTNVADEELAYHTSSKDYNDEVLDRLAEKNEYIDKLENLLSDLYKDVETVKLWNNDIIDANENFELDENEVEFKTEVVSSASEIAKEVKLMLDKLDEYVI